MQDDRFQNRYSFLMEGRVITLAPLSPREAHEDQLKIKRGSGQSSGDGSTKERIERVAYCSNQPLMELEPNVSFQQKIEIEFPKPFYNVRVKIRGRILFKKRGMMQSEVLYKVRSHGESQRSRSLAEGQEIHNLLDSINRMPSLVDRFVQSLSVATSNLSAAALDFPAWFPISCQDNFQHSFLVFRAFRIYF